MAAPLRCLQEVITSIVDRKFSPDKTRSGMFADEVELQAAQDRYSGEPVESSSESSGDEEDHEFGRDEEAIDRMAGEWQGNKITPWMTLAAVYYRHNTSRCIHVLQDEGERSFAVAVVYQWPMSDLNVVLSLCIQCALLVKESLKGMHHDGIFWTGDVPVCAMAQQLGE